MENRLQAALAATLFAAASAASGQDLTEAQARAVIAPWYGLFNQPVQSDVVKTVREQMHDTSRYTAHTKRHHHQAKLGNGRVGENAFDVRLSDRDERSHECCGDTDPHDHG